MHQLGILDRQQQPAIGDRGVRMGCAHLRDERQRIPDETLGHRLRVESRRSHTARTLPDELDGELRGPLQLFGPPRKQKREYRVAQEPGLNEVRPGNTKIGKRGLERGAVPEGNRNGFLRGEAVVHRDIRRHCRPGFDSNPLRDAPTDTRIYCPAVRSLSRCRARAAGDARKCREQTSPSHHCQQT